MKYLNVIISGNEKNEILSNLEKAIHNTGFNIVQKDFSRPWGGFFVVDENQMASFIEIYFPEIKERINVKNKLSPKFLVVAPGQRLSWQYHFRRSEWWRVVGGTVSVACSDTDEEKEIKQYVQGEIINLPVSTRHRLIGLKDWGVVAEIWEHTDASNPSDEEDIVRLQDDYSRK